MKVKIATYNLNNLFERPKVMELEGFSETGREVLADISTLNSLLESESYAGETGKKILDILAKYFHNQADNPWFTINEVREKLFTRKRDGSGLTLKAKGRADWIGWVEITKQKTNEISLENTARVVKSVSADILCTIEVDSRIALKNFNEKVLKPFKLQYAHAMVIDGNDDRGIDVGLLSQYDIAGIVSHIDDFYLDKAKRKQKIFSRDCAEYKVNIGGKSLTILCNHLKSKGYGSAESSNKKRKLQADRVCGILDSYDLEKEFVVVAGDFNDTPKSAPLNNLMKYKNLSDVLNSKLFKGERWTYHTGKGQIDYLLVSKALLDCMIEVNIERRGVFTKNNTTFAEVTNSVTQASDHACVWATFEI